MSNHHQDVSDARGLAMSHANAQNLPPVVNAYTTMTLKHANPKQINAQTVEINIELAIGDVQSILEPHVYRLYAITKEFPGIGLNK